MSATESRWKGPYLLALMRATFARIDPLDLDRQPVAHLRYEDNGRCLIQTVRSRVHPLRLSSVDVDLTRASGTFAGANVSDVCVSTCAGGTRPE